MKAQSGARWSGETTTCEDGWEEGTALVLSDSSVRGKAKPQELVVQVGDYVYITGGEVGEPAEIVQTVDIFANPENPGSASATCMWWREYMEASSFADWPTRPPHARELFMQTDRDTTECPVGSHAPWATGTAAAAAGLAVRADCSSALAFGFRARPVYMPLACRPAVNLRPHLT